MSVRYSFRLQSPDARRNLPHKLLLAQEYDEAPVDVLLRLLGYLLFFRERLEVMANLHDDNIPFRPDLVQVDYQLRPVLWVECGACAVDKLDRLAVKVPEAELWVLRASPDQAEALLHAMAKADLRRNRYHVLAFDAAMVEEMLGLLAPRNEMFWVESRLDPPLVRFEFNGLWFDHEFTVQRF